MILFCIAKLSYIKLALYFEFASIPPTKAAAFITASTLFVFKKLNTFD